MGSALLSVGVSFSAIGWYRLLGGDLRGLGCLLLGVFVCACVHRRYDVRFERRA